MKLILRHNHFFRSFWSIKNAEAISEIDIKYFDLDNLTAKTLEYWLADPKNTGMFGGRRQRKLTSCHVDVSYWNTYNIHGYERAGRYIERMVKDMYNYGSKNFRTDNMTNRQFFSITTYGDKQYYSNDWKLSQITILYTYIKPHWNLCNCTSRNRPLYK
jgi:hypothetical protein